MKRGRRANGTRSNIAFFFAKGCIFWSTSRTFRIPASVAHSAAKSSGVQNRHEVRRP